MSGRTIAKAKCVDVVHTKLLQLEKFSINRVSDMSASAGERPVSQTRDVTINIRAKQNQRDLIDYAAAVQGKNRSEFMLVSAYQKAQDVLLDRYFFGLDELKFKQFVALLDAPPAQNEKLRTLLTAQAPWD